MFPLKLRLYFFIFTLIAFVVVMSIMVIATGYEVEQILGAYKSVAQAFSNRNARVMRVDDFHALQAWERMREGSYDDGSQILNDNNTDVFDNPSEIQVTRNFTIDWSTQNTTKVIEVNGVQVNAKIHYTIDFDGESIPVFKNATSAQRVDGSGSITINHEALKQFTSSIVVPMRTPEGGSTTRAFRTHSSLTDLAQQTFQALHDRVPRFIISETGSWSSRETTHNHPNGVAIDFNWAWNGYYVLNSSGVFIGFGAASPAPFTMEYTSTWDKYNKLVQNNDEGAAYTYIIIRDAIEVLAEFGWTQLNDPSGGVTTIGTHHFSLNGN